jgi:enoyl-CoA hydratase/carnithine racemase
MAPLCLVWRSKLIEASQQGRVLHLALNRPEKRNALNISLCRALIEAFAQANLDPTIGVILLSGNGPAFCAGMDLKEALDPGGVDLADLHERLFTIINRTHKPIVAAVQGAAVAGGTGLAANAHIVIAAPDAKFGLTEIRIGLWPVIVFRAVALAIGERRATELSITGRFLGAQEAMEYGLVTEIADEPLERARTIAAEVAAFSPHTLASGLAYTRQIRGMAWEQAGVLGRETRDELMKRPEFAKGIQAFLQGPART